MKNNEILEFVTLREHQKQMQIRKQMFPGLQNGDFLQVRITKNYSCIMFMMKRCFITGFGIYGKITFEIAIAVKEMPADVFYRSDNAGLDLSEIMKQLKTALDNEVLNVKQ